MRDADQHLIWKGLTTEPPVVEQRSDEPCPVEPDDIIPIFHALRSMVGEAKKIGLREDDLGHYKRVLLRLEAPIRNDQRTIHFNGYDIYWARKACNFWCPLMRKYDPRNPDLPALERATQHLNAIQGDMMEHQIEEGHKRQS